MECKKALEKLYDYSKGEVTQSIKEDISSHISGCPACAAEYAALKRIRSAINASAVEPPPAVLEAIRLRMASASLSSRRTGLRRFLKPALAMAAGLLLTVTAGVYAARELNDRSEMARYMLENYEVVEHAYYDNSSLENGADMLYEGII